ncbi:MAG TPA: response regulator [Herpetosiphonaceae bacterium]
MRQRIAVIEDAREILTLIHDILTDEGYEVMPFTSPVPALEAMTRERPDLIILDCIFNQAYSGRWVLRMLKSNLETAHIPIILCTAAVPLPEDVAAYIANHQVAFLPKPFSIDDLLGLVEQLTQR